MRAITQSAFGDPSVLGTVQVDRPEPDHGQVVNVRPSAADLSRLVALAESGRLRVHVDQAPPLTEVAKAHELLSTRRTTGKIVLIP
ncbi:zinc-binding dehydrogenase [Streptosporangium sp. CA-115845]|uniref:zinc-binding dehydrogenase n=1 Tax=Streptosporangium sp. CA-115845 TaxID=3240071 RepID=UPI003D911546